MTVIHTPIAISPQRVDNPAIVHGLTDNRGSGTTRRYLPFSPIHTPYYYNYSFSINL